MRRFYFFPIFYFSFILPLFSGPIPEGFILIKGGIFSGEAATGDLDAQRVEDFEILDHAVTNAEYRIFVDETDYPVPLHWTDGAIPAGREDHPVIYVNRQDVKAFLKWLNDKDSRCYRLPTTVEFTYAASCGHKDRLYPWGDDDPKDLANYDGDFSRPFDRWEDYLKPARWGEKNEFGLYCMAGNVWNMAINDHDPATSLWKYRIEDTDLLEGSIMGGSWARGPSYLRCGDQLSLSPGIRHPDTGFRPVRQPRGADWRVRHRRLCAVSLGNGRIQLSWALLSTDKKSDGFHVFRATARNHAGMRVTLGSVNSSTTFIDRDLKIGKRYFYYVRPVDNGGKMGRRSEWCGITVAENLSPVVTTFKPLFKQGSLVPIFGDVDGDGTADCVIRMDNGNREMSQDPGLPVQLEAFTSYGRSLWRKDICAHDHCYGSANNVPFNVWDMDNDGKAEVITRLQIGDSVFVAILDGLTGRLKFKTPWPQMVSDTQKSSTRIHMSIAYLDGEHPAVVTQTGLYENEVFVAYDSRLGKLWRFDSFAATSGSGGHKIEIADVDGDGRQEVFDGTTCLNDDGTLRWSIYKQHPDIVSIHDHLPDRPGLEVFYIVESSVFAGVYMVDANSGDIIWKVNREDDPRWTHGHRGWSSDIWRDSPGIECVSNRAGHDDYNLILFSADGHVLLEPFPSGYNPVEWDGDLTRELLSENGTRIGNFDGEDVQLVSGISPNPFPEASLLMVADLYGDFRDELILTMGEDDGGRVISVVTATDPIDNRYVTAAEDRDYSLWLARNMGGGYRSIYDRVLR